jgi:nitroreductase
MINNAALSFLQQRNSQSRLALPAPSAQELTEIIKAAVRAPDHARLQPWRFLMIDGDARLELGALFVEAQLRVEPGLSTEKQQKLLNNPLRAPLIITVIAKVVEHAKVPAIEQLLSAGCAALNILLAVEALGYAGIWRTGDMAYDDFVQQKLGLDDMETIIGFLYVGTPEGDPKPLNDIDITPLISYWPVN